MQLKSGLGHLGRVIKKRIYQAFLFRVDMPPGNIFDCDPTATLRGSVEIRKGSGNRIEIGKGARFKGTISMIGDNNVIRIGEGCHFRGRIVVNSGTNQIVSFGNHSTSVDLYIVCSENCDVTIGEWCMFSRAVEVRTSDSHSVIERASGERLNHPGSIVIGDHVWVGVGAIINKGVRLPEDCIVGAQSFVNRCFDESGIMLAGAPADIVRRGITWSRGRKPRFTPDEMDFWRR